MSTEPYEEDLICLHCGATLGAVISLGVPLADYVRTAECPRCGRAGLAVNLPARIAKNAGARGRR